MGLRGTSLKASAPILALVVFGCLGGDKPLPPDEALAKANSRINAILQRDQDIVGEPIEFQPSQPSRDHIAISFWFYSHPLMSHLLHQPQSLESFRAAHPDVALSCQFIGDWYVAVQKLTVSLAAGDLPDIALVKRSWLAHLAKAGRAVPLDAVLPPSMIADLRAPSRNALTFDGHLFAVPADGFCSALYYNCDLIGDKPPKNWQELRQVAAACPHSSKDPSPITVWPIGDVPFLTTLWSAGGDVCDERQSKLDNPPAHEALNFLLALRADNLAAERTLGSPDSAFQLFLSGRIAMTVWSTEDWPAAQKAKFLAGIAPIPGKNGPISALSDNAIVVFSPFSEAKREGIAALLDFLTGPAIQGADAAELGSAPVRDSVARTTPGLPGVEQAYICARATPLVPSWSAIEFELDRHLDMAYNWRPTNKE